MVENDGGSHRLIFELCDIDDEISYFALGLISRPLKSEQFQKLWDSYFVWLICISFV